MKVSILAENNTTQKLLKTHTAELKAALLEHGIRLEKMDVEISFKFRPVHVAGKTGFTQITHNRERVFSWTIFLKSLAPKPSQTETPCLGIPSGSLDLIA